MSRKDNLKKRVDALCKELGITESQYDDKTTEAQLNTLIDDLEAKLPDGDESENEGEDKTPPQGNDVEHSSSTEEQQTENQAGANLQVLVGIGDLPEGETVDSDAPAAKAIVNERGNIQVRVSKSFQCYVDGETMLLKAGETPFLDEDTAMEAVEAGLAHIIATL